MTRCSLSDVTNQDFVYIPIIYNQRENSELELPSAVGQVKLEEIGDAEVEGAVKKIKRGHATDIEVCVEMLVMPMAERAGRPAGQCVFFCSEKKISRCKNR